MVADGMIVANASKLNGYSSVKAWIFKELDSEKSLNKEHAWVTTMKVLGVGILSITE